MITRRFFSLTLIFCILLLGMVPNTPINAQTRQVQAAAPAWQMLPGPTGGSVVDIVLSPDFATDNILYAGLSGRGVYRSQNGAYDWSPAGLDDQVVVDLAISPDFATDDTLFALSGLWTTGYKVQRSTDRGDSWQPTSSPTAFPDALTLVVSPNFASDQMIYLLTGHNNLTYTSVDGGSVFIAADGWLAAHDVIAMAFSPAYAIDQILFAIVPNDGLYKSTDGGVTWLPTGLSGNLSTLAVSPDFAVDHMLLVIAASGLVHMSTDGGVTWAVVPGLTLASGGDFSIAFSPTFATDRVIQVASSVDPGPFRSLDGGVSWQTAGWYDPASSYQDGLLGGGVLALALAPNQTWDGRAFAATRAGIAFSAHRGDSWYQMNDGLPQLTVRAFALAPNDPQVMLAGTGYFEQLRFDSGSITDDAGNVQLSSDGGQSWRQVSGRLARVNGVAFSPNFAVDETAFAATGMIGQHGFVEGGIYRTTDGGENWTAVSPVSHAYNAIAISPNYANDHTVWASALSYTMAVGVYRSTDGGSTWALVAPGLYVQRLVVSPNFAIDQTLFAGMADDGIHRSTNGGLVWTRVMPTAYVTALAISPAYGASQTVYAAARVNTYSATAVYRTTDGGATWQTLPITIPPEQNGQPLVIGSLAFGVDGSVLAGAQYGVSGTPFAYRSIAGGTNWQPVAGALSGTAVSALTSTPTQSFRLYAAGDGGIQAATISQGSLAEGGAWQSEGPRGGKASALVVSPNFAADGLAFAGDWLTSFRGSESGLGIIRSQDAGQTWAPSFAGTEAYEYSTAVHDFAFSPDFATDQTVFAATWGGLFRSADAGQTWAQVEALYNGPPGAITDVAVAPDFAASGHLVAAGGYGGLNVSEDGGQTWTGLNFSLGELTYSPDFAADQTIFGGRGDGFYRSTDRGLTWTGVLSQSVTAVAVSPNFAADQTVWGGGQAIYLSTDGGTTWISRTVAAEVTYIWALAVSPQFAVDQTLFAGSDSGLYWSVDGGLTWMAVPEYAGISISRLAISPQWPGDATLLVGTPSGVFRLLSADPSTGLVKEAADGFAVLRSGVLALSDDESLLLAGTSDHGVFGSLDGGHHWQPQGLQGGNSYYSIAALAISPDVANDQTMFAASASGTGIGASIYRTQTGGAAWTNVYNTDYVSSLAISPGFAGDGTIYATGNNGRVQRSIDDGATWLPLPNWPPDVSSRAQKLALPPDVPADGRLFVGSSNGFWLTPDNGATWTKALTGLNGDQYVSDLRVSPNFAIDQTLLAAASWSNPPDYTQHAAVFRSTDGGANWTPVMDGLPEQEIGGLAFSPDFATDRTAYALAGQELYRSRDGGVRWTLVGSPPGAPWLQDVAVDGAGNVFVASTAGVWRYSTLATSVLINGGFEADGGWELPVTPTPGEYSPQVVYNGRRALQVGLDNEANVYGYSSARQVVTIPAGIAGANLSFYVYPVSGEATAVSQTAVFPEQVAAADRLPAQPASGDAQYVLLLDPSTQAIVGTIYWGLSNGQAWQRVDANLKPYAGRSLLLLFGAYNDGWNGRTALYVDDVVLNLIDTTGAAHHIFLPAAVK